jgi:hypothetical protein
MFGPFAAAADEPPATTLATSVDVISTRANLVLRMATGTFMSPVLLHFTVA